ncbi:MAG TPA: hypothetical protein VGV38_20395 [Pyrinomonadaceae bacterium]|nr:hypothetical protein [Pyrinomonadaceae bacterium]
MTTKATDEHAELGRGVATCHLEPVARNAFRVLGLGSDASGREVHEAAARVRRAHKLGVVLSTPRDAAWLGPVPRAESDLRDALGRLSDPARRARERLFWSHTPEHLADADTFEKACAFVSESLASVHSSLATEAEPLGPFEPSPTQLHDAALLLLSAAQRFDPALRRVEVWSRALSLWKELAARGDFWSLLVAADLKGDFEQLVTHGEVRSLRRDALRLVTAPVVELAHGALAREDRRTARAAISVLRGAGLPPELQTEYENDILAPFEARAEKLCEEAYAEGFKLNIFATGGNPGARMMDAALTKFNETVRPALLDFLQLAGAEGPVGRRVFAQAAECLNNIAEGYRVREFFPMAVRTARKAWALAPPASHALLLVEDKLKTLGAEPGEKTEGDYAEELRRELRPRPRLFAAYGEAPPEENLLQLMDRLGPPSRGRVWAKRFAAGVFLLLCFAAGWWMSSRGGSRRGRTRLPPPMSSETPFRLSIPPSSVNAEQMERLREELERIGQNLNRLERRARPAPTPRRQRRRRPTTNDER